MCSRACDMLSAKNQANGWKFDTLAPLMAPVVLIIVLGVPPNPRAPTFFYATRLSSIQRRMERTINVLYRYKPNETKSHFIVPRGGNVFAHLSLGCKSELVFFAVVVEIRKSRIITGTLSFWHTPKSLLSKINWGWYLQEHDYQLLNCGESWTGQNQLYGRGCQTWNSSVLG